MIPNGYFKKKQKEYLDSEIIITKDMASPSITDWDLDSIIERDIRTSDRILEILDSWNQEYKESIESKSTDDAGQPSAEQQAMIEEFKKKGWV